MCQGQNLSFTVKGSVVYQNKIDTGATDLRMNQTFIKKNYKNVVPSTCHTCGYNPLNNPEKYQQNEIT